MGAGLQICLGTYNGGVTGLNLNNLSITNSACDGMSIIGGSGGGALSKAIMSYVNIPNYGLGGGSRYGLWARFDAVGSMTVSNSTIVEYLNASADFTFNFVTSNIPVTVQTSPSGQTFTVDGTNYSSAQIFNWIYGSSHTVATTSPQSGGTGIQYVLGSANASCYGFANWTLYGNVVSTSPCYTLTATSNETLVANFTPLAYITISTSSSPPGGGSTSGGGTVPCGSNVTVCATASPCYSFANWTDQHSNVVSISACYTFTPDGNANLAANFIPTTYTITASSSPAEAGSITGGGPVICGSNVTLCAIPTPCYTFVNWTVNSDVIGTSVCYDFTVAGNEAVVANFAPISYGGSTPGSLTTLHSFDYYDGAYPYAGLAQGGDSNFYGTTEEGGASGYGTVFRITPSGSLTNLHSFSYSDGAYPYAGLAQGSDSNFNGTTE
jgi:uncharacterized repeat protein (TIGR03803 family)